MQCTDAIAFEAAAALDAYEARLLTLRCAGTDPHAIASLQADLKRVCGCCLRLPQLSGASVALLLAHHRLLAELTRPVVDGDKGGLTPGFRAVEQCVGLLQRGFRRLFLSPHLL